MAEHNTAIFNSMKFTQNNGKNYAWIVAVYVVGTED